MEVYGYGFENPAAALGVRDGLLGGEAVPVPEVDLVDEEEQSVREAVPGRAVLAGPVAPPTTLPSGSTFWCNLRVTKRSK